MRILFVLLPLALIAADPKPGVKTPGVRIPITALKPDQIFEVPGSPDWILVEDSVWVSNKPKNSVTRIDPKTNKVVGVINVGSKPCSGLAAGFGSLCGWRHGAECASVRCDPRLIGCKETSGASKLQLISSGHTLTSVPTGFRFPLTSHRGNAIAKGLFRQRAERGRLTRK